MNFQSYEEKVRVFADYDQNFCPQDLLNNQHNANALIGYVDSYLAGVFTVSNLIAAEKALREAGALQLVAPPSAEEVQAQAVEEQSRRFREAHYKALRENQVERKFDAEVTAKVEVDKRAKELADVEKTISAVISNYSCSTIKGAINYSETNRLRAYLRQVEVRRDGKRDPELTLKKIRELISQLPS